MARRLSVLQCLCFMFLVVSLLVLKTHSLLVYERQTLLNIRDSLLKLPNVSERCGGLPPPLASVPGELHRRDPPGILRNGSAGEVDECAARALGSVFGSEIGCGGSLPSVTLAA